MDNEKDATLIAKQFGDVYERIARAETEYRGYNDYLIDSISGILREANRLKKKTNRQGLALFCLSGFVAVGGYILQQQVDNLNAKVDKVVKGA